MTFKVPVSERYITVLIFKIPCQIKTDQNIAVAHNKTNDRNNKNNEKGQRQTTTTKATTKTTTRPLRLPPRTTNTTTCNNSWFDYFRVRIWSCSSPPPNLNDHPPSAARNYLLSIFAVTLHTWRPPSPSETWKRAKPWWIENHWILTYKNRLSFPIVGVHLN
jgi:hypothetical protein